MAEAKPETKSSGGWNLDGIAAKLQAKADEVLKSTSSAASAGGDEDASAAGGKREALRNVANIVKGQAGKGLDSSKEYLTKVVEQVSSYATDASSTASTQFAGVKEKGLTHVNAASEAANTHYATVKTNLNKAIAQGQAKGQAKGQGQAEAPVTSTDADADSGTTERALPTEEEPVSFPFNIIAWFVSLCHGTGTSTTVPATSGSTSSTSKDFSVESLQNAAATLTSTLSQEAHSVNEQTKAASEKAAKSSGSGEA